jgi:ABC-type transport system involved in multi-copper enzyme maturation permease subunit
MSTTQQPITAPSTHPVPPHIPQPSAVRAWFYLVALSWQRQARMRQMLWIAMGLLVFSAVLVGIQTALNIWDIHTWKWPGRGWPTYSVWIDDLQATTTAFPFASPGNTANQALLASVQLVLDRSPFRVFTSGVVMTLFLGFLLPIWSLSFATEALGGERENNSLIWLLSRPLPRPAVYLAKYVAFLPWSLGLNLGGFALLCWLGGAPGFQALAAYWPIVIWTTLAFTALFHLMGAFFRRPAIMAILYVFFLEIILNQMPGYVKRLSITFYARCLTFEAGQDFGVQPRNPQLFMPVEGATALTILTAVTVGLLALGTVVFSRSQYQDVV